jgi:hypothetical protein
LANDNSCERFSPDKKAPFPTIALFIESWPVTGLKEIDASSLSTAACFLSAPNPGTSEGMLL